MALITFPTTVLPNRATVRPVPNVAVSMSQFTFEAQKQVFDAFRWEIDLEYPPITDRTAIGELEAFLLKLNGQENTTLVPDFDQATPNGIGTGTPLVNGASQTGETLVTDGWTASQTGILKAGDKISVENYIYMVVDDANSDGSGNATFNIKPALRSSPANNASIDVTYPATLCRLATNIVSLPKDRNGYLTGFTLVFVEEL